MLLSYRDNHRSHHLKVKCSLKIVKMTERTLGYNLIQCPHHSHLANTFFLSPHYLPGTALGAEDAMMSQTAALPTQILGPGGGVVVGWGRQTVKVLSTWQVAIRFRKGEVTILSWGQTRAGAVLAS